MITLNKPLFFAIVFLTLSVAIKAENQLTDHLINAVYIPEISGQIIIDGKLDEEVWKKSASFPSFVRTAGERTGEKADYLTESFSFRNGNKLFIAFVCHDPDTRYLTGSVSEWDDPNIIYDDRVEIFIDCDHDHRDYYELAVNSKGIQFDQRLFLRYPKTRTNESHPEWNCNWKARTSIMEDRWIAEIEIDMTSPGMSKVVNGTTWGFNVARAARPEMKKGKELMPLSKETEYSAWCKTKDGIWETLSDFQEPADFGDLIFGEPVVDIRNIRFKNAVFVMGGNKVPPSYVGLNPMEIQFGEPVTKETGLILYLSTTSKNKKVWNSKMEIETGGSDMFSANYFINEDEESRFDIEIREKNTNSLVFQTAYILTVPPFIDFDLSALYQRDKKDNRPVSYRLMVDQVTLDSSLLETVLYNEEEKLICSKTITGLTKTDNFQILFNTDSLRALPGGNYFFRNILSSKNNKENISTFIQPFTKIELNVPDQFKAVRGPYRYAGMKGDAVQVFFPNGQRYVFWEKAGNVPFWDVDQVALTYEFVESNGFTTQGCTEAMQDRQCRYSTVEIIENTPARIIVHWRYALTDAHYRIHNNEWVDEYYRFYPDGVGVRDVNLWANGNEVHEFFEIIPVNPPSMQEKDMFDGYVARLGNLSGESYTTDDFNKNGNAFRENFLKSDDDFLIDVNLKNRMHPFAVFTYRDSINPGVSYKTITLCSPREYNSASHRAHWPASQYEIDGYNLVGNHRPSHGNIGSIKSRVDSVNNPNRFTVLLGIATQGFKTGYEYGCSWLNPGKIVSLTSPHCYLKYDINQRAYLFEPSSKKTSLRFNLSPAGYAIKNPVFVLKGIDEERIKMVLINGRTLNNSEFETGNSNDNDCVIFVKRTIEKEQTIEIRF